MTTKVTGYYTYNINLDGTVTVKQYNMDEVLLDTLTFKDEDALNEWIDTPIEVM